MTKYETVHDPEIRAQSDAVRDAWRSVPAPPAEDLEYMAWAWGDEAAEAFTGVAPMDVDRDSLGFYAAYPLLDLKARPVAAYLGTYLLELLHSLDVQKAIGIFGDPRLRAHVITFLELPHCWEKVKPHLSPQCRKVLAEVALYIASQHEYFGSLDVETIKANAADYLKSLEDK